MVLVVRAVMAVSACHVMLPRRLWQAAGIAVSLPGFQPCFGEAGDSLALAA